LDAPKGTRFFKVLLASPLKSEGTADVRVRTTFTHTLTPLPAEIAQEQPQLVLYKGNLYAYAAYPSDKQVLQIKLATAHIESYTKHKTSSVHEDTVSYGPLENVAALSVSDISVHFENNSPFATMRTMERDIEVSQWGNIAIEEKYLIEHTGARLKGSFSRYDYQRNPNQQSQASFRYITAVLPPTARDIYYRDQIGNVSTSHVREDDNAIIMQVLPRFPLFGGWKTDFYMGYNVPAWQYLSKEDGISFTYVLNVTFGSPFPQVSVDSAVVRVILPEGASNIQWSTPFDIDEEASSTVISYLDTSGRPALLLKKANVVHHHNDYFQVSYRFPAVYMLREPVFLMLAFAAFFAASMAYMRVELSISERVSKAGASSRSGRVGDLINRVVDAYPRLNSVFRSRNDDAITAADKDFQDIQSTLSEIAKEPSLASKANGIEAKLIKFRGLAKKAVKAKDATEARAKLDAQSQELDELVSALSSS